MIYCLYGPDTYRSRRKLNEIIGEYRVRAGSSLNFHRFDAEEQDFGVLRTVVETSSLFSPKKLVVIEYALSSGTNFGELLKIVKRAKDSRDTVLLLWDRELDAAAKKRLEEIKPLVNKSQEFKGFSVSEMSRWIREEAGRRGLRLGAADLMRLTSRRSDLWGITNEMEKMALAQPLDRTNESDQTTRTYRTDRANTPTIFALGDTFFTAPRRAVSTLLHLVSEGHDDFNLLSYLVNHARTLLTVKVYAETNRPVPDHHNLHPYVVKKASVLARGIPRGRLVTTLQRFFEEDWKIKTGLTRPYDALVRMLYRTRG